MKFFQKTWKFVFAIIIFVGLFYIIMTTLNHNVSIQKAQAQQAKSTPITRIETIVLEKTITKNPLVLIGTLKPFDVLEFLSDTEGKVTEIFFDLHQQVTVGQILAKTDTKLKQTQSNIAELNFKKAKRDFERLEVLYQNKNLSAVDFENAKFQMQQAEQNFILTQQTIDYGIIKSPMNGNITQKSISKGKYLQMGSPIATITDVSQFRLMVNVAPQDLYKILIGTYIPVKIQDFKNNSENNLKGFVKSISVQSNEAGSFPVEIIIQNTHHNNNNNILRAGMQAEIIIEGENTQREMLLIPRTALVGEDVFVLENGKNIRKKITLGREYQEFIEVVAGLKEGDKLIVKGQN